MNPEQKPCCRKRRGRPRASQVLDGERRYRCYAPLCRPGHRMGEPVLLVAEELEVLRLVDLEGMGQEEAANAIGISRRTLWKDLHEARRKVADALVNGKAIRVVGCLANDDGSCNLEDDQAEDEKAV